MPKTDLCRLKNGTIVCAEGWEISCEAHACVQKGTGQGTKIAKNSGKSGENEEEEKGKEKSKGKKDDKKEGKKMDNGNEDSYPGKSLKKDPDMSKKLDKEEKSSSKKSGQDYSDISDTKGRL
jgi:hypothetical protein